MSLPGPLGFVCSSVPSGSSFAPQDFSCVSDWTPSSHCLLCIAFLPEETQEEKGCANITLLAGSVLHDGTQNHL